MRARSYHASPGLAKASVLCISVWMIYINTLVSRRRAVDWRVCGNVDNRLGPTGRRSGLASLSTDEAGAHSPCGDRYTARSWRPCAFRCSGCQAQIRCARVDGCLRLRQSAGGCRRCRHGCLRRYRRTSRFTGGESDPGRQRRINMSARALLVFSRA